jgi:hypothetical protein
LVNNSTHNAEQEFSRVEHEILLKKTTKKTLMSKEKDKEQMSKNLRSEDHQAPQNYRDRST